MKHERFIAWCLSTPWALQPEIMTAFARVLAHRSAGTGMVDESAGSARANATATGRQRSNRAGAVAVIPIYGTIVQRASQLGICEGGTSTQAIANALADANADDSVSQILLDIDSGGGSVYGVQELGDQIVASRKPVTAIANSLAASAAYWIGSQASEFYCTPGGEVGSIGVWMAHEDWSKALEMEGIDVTLISAGEYKVEGNPYGPLGDDARKFMQSRVTDYFNTFTRAVAKGRKVSVDTVRNGMGKGRVLGADDARGRNMIDGVKTLDQVVGSMQRRVAPAGRSAKAPARLARARRELAILGID